MKMNYYKETDSLYIDLSSKNSVESKEVAEGVVLDYDEDGNLTGIDIDNASKKLDLKELVISHLPQGSSLAPFARFYAVSMRLENHPLGFCAITMPLRWSSAGREARA